MISGRADRPLHTVTYRYDRPLHTVTYRYHLPIGALTEILICNHRGDAAVDEASLAHAASEAHLPGRITLLEAIPLMHDDPHLVDPIAGPTGAKPLVDCGDAVCERRLRWRVGRCGQRGRREMLQDVEVHAGVKMTLVDVQPPFPVAQAFTLLEEHPATLRRKLKARRLALL